MGYVPLSDGTVVELLFDDEMLNVKYHNHRWKVIGYDTSIIRVDSLTDPWVGNMIFPWAHILQAKPKPI